MLRLFVGIEFPPELKLHLSLLETGIPGAKWVDPGNLHLTLRFIGAVDEGVAADIDEALSLLRARRFTLQLAGTGVFGGNRPHALWVGAERDPGLVGLRDKIEQALIRIFARCSAEGVVASGAANSVPLASSRPASMTSGVDAANPSGRLATSQVIAR